MNSIKLLAAIPAMLISTIVSGCGNEPASTPTANRETREVEFARHVCRIGQPLEQDVVAVTERYELRSEPNSAASRIVNERASEVTRRTQFHVIDSSTTVRRLCSDGDWVEVQIESPSWLTFVVGWAPSGYLRQIDTDSLGQRVYVESDFIWDDYTEPYREELIVIMNRISRERRGCDELDTASLTQSPSRSSPGDPVFFVTCGTGGTVFNVWFRIQDFE